MYLQVAAVRLCPKCGQWLSLGRALEMPPPGSGCLYKWQLCGQETWLLAQHWHMGGCWLLMQSRLKLIASKQGSFNGQQTLTWQFRSWAALLINESKVSTQVMSSSTDWCISRFIMSNSLLENAYLMMCLQSFKSCPGNVDTSFGPEQSLTLKELHFKGMAYFQLLLSARWVFGSVKQAPAWAKPYFALHMIIKMFTENINRTLHLDGFLMLRVPKLFLIKIADYAPW